MDTELNHFTNNNLPPTIISSTGTQMFITYTNNENGGYGKGFSASFAFGKKNPIQSFLGKQGFFIA